MTHGARTRIGWRDLPAPVRARVEQIIGGGAVVAADSQPGGFSPGTADRVRTDSGRRAFVKAVAPVINPVSAEMARREIRITADMPAGAPVPRMLGGFDDGEWVVLVVEDIDGVHPRTPWVEPEIDAAVTALRELAEAVTPPPAGAPRAGEQFAEDFAGWEGVAADPPADLDAWERDRLPDLRAASARVAAALHTGDTFGHYDIRADNMLVRPDGRVVIVDWPWASVGPAWFDTACLAADIVVHGGDPERVIAGLDRRIVTDLFAGLMGMYRHHGRLPPPPGIPTVREFQRWQVERLRPWVRAEL